MSVRGVSLPRHVLVTTDALGGTWCYAADLAAGLAARDIAVTLVVLGPAPSAWQLAEVATLPGLAVRLLPFPLDWMAPDLSSVAAAAGAVAALAAAQRADLVHLNSPALAGLAKFAMPVIGVCHSCLASWWDAVHPGEALPQDFAWRTAMLARGYAACDRLLAPTGAYAAATARLHRLPQLPGVVHNGRSWPQLSADPAPPFAFTAGRLWDRGKNARTLDAAAKDLPLPFLAAGALRSPQGERVTFEKLGLLGQLDAAAMQRQLARQPVFVSAALYEPFGLAVLEAAQAGCALVLSEIPSFRELWSGAAIFVRPDDATGFAEAIAALARDGERRRDVGVAAEQRARRYSAHAMLQGVLAQYQQVLQGREEAA